MIRPAIPRVPWTAAEDATIHRLYPAGGAVTLPGRSLCAIQHRAQRLGVATRHRRWTPSNDRRLADLWDSTRSLRSIAKALDRTPITTYWRAQKLGLPLGVPPGYEYLTAAAVRTGYDTGQLRRILRWAGVKIHRVRTRGEGPGYAYVEPFDVDEAVEAWHRTESVESGARARGLAGDTLRSWLRAAGVPEGKRARKEHWRVETAVIDRVVAERRECVSLCEAARRAGVHRMTLRRRLERVGVRANGRRWLVSLEVVAQLCA